MKAYTQLKKIFQRLAHLQYMQRILMWDEAVMMPEGAGKSRANALGTLNRVMQKMLINKRIPANITEAKNSDLNGWDMANLAWMEKEYVRANSIPLKLTENLTTAALGCEQAWRQMRAQNNWQDFLPHLTRTFSLVKEIANRRADILQIKPYDVLLEDYAPGFNQNSIDKVFAKLKTELPILIREIAHQQQSELIEPPVGPFLVVKQKQLGLRLMQALGFDFKHGRLDVSHHPFCSGGPTDVRITTRYSEHEFIQSLAAICHETGHALYEQGLPKKWLEQPVGRIHSMAQHESQSLLIEMDVCRSPSFSEFLAPLVQAEFGKNKDFSATSLNKLITRVQPGLIRVDADEVTYPMHVILRYEIEQALFNNEIGIADLPSVWHELMSKYLNLSTLGDDQHGVMQDVHWPSGAFGYFPAYTLGRLMAAQFFSSYSADHPSYANDFRLGHFHSLQKWLQKNVYNHASSIATEDLLMKATGKSLDPTFYIQHIKQRYLN